MSGYMLGHYKEAYIITHDNPHKVVDRSHMSSSEIEDGIEERRMEVMIG